MKNLDQIKEESISLLKELIAIPSFSQEESKTADKIFDFLSSLGIEINRKANNVWVKNQHFQENLPTLLLNSHLDTIKPSEGWTRDPFDPQLSSGKLFGLGSTDAGGSVISLLATFIHYYNKNDLNFNIIYSTTGEEENSGVNGIELILDDLGNIDFAIIGEPTDMEMAISEKGLVVLDCFARGKAGHAARNTGENAIIKAIKDINWFHSYQFPKVSETLGPVQMMVTIIEAGLQHNIIPDICKFTVDIRSTDVYTNEEIVEIVRENVTCDVNPRSTRLRPSSIKKDHPLAKAATEIGIPLFGSPTTSDQAVISFPSVKIGPGKPERSHTADEYICLSEIEKGIEKYIKLLNQLNVLIK